MTQQIPQLATAFFLAAAVNLVAAGSAWAFHVGGVGACDNCHSMHNPRGSGASGGSLLLASDPSSVCLNCHAGPGGSNSGSVFSPDGSALTPGGDFYWLTRTFTWSTGASYGDSHGHNIIAQDFNLAQDLRLSQAPGGTYQSIDLGCTSCHDPHGEVQGGTGRGRLPISVSGSYGELPAAGTIRGNYRLLGDARYDAGEPTAGYQFIYDAPVARQNINSRFSESDASHVDYGIGMSEWCGNCHQNLLLNDHETAADFAHSAGSSALLTNETANMYNSYIRTGELTGTSATSYLQFVPFERGTSDFQQLDPTSRQGPNTNSRVMCLTCHRAHSSAFRTAGRWDFDAVLLAESHPASSDGGVSGNDVYYSYYGRDISAEFGLGQGSFCEKCHGISAEPLLEPSMQQLPEQDPFLQEPFQPF